MTAKPDKPEKRDGQAFAATRGPITAGTGRGRLPSAAVSDQGPSRETDHKTGHRADHADVRVTECRAVTDELVEAMDRLVPQLSSSNPPPTRAQLEEIVASPATMLLLARNRGRVVGALTLVVFRIPTGVRTRIEDVVVDESMRGRRVGEQLSAAALAEARRLGARSTDLTSRPAREAANRLYQRMGFEQRESNVYRYTL